jgi:UPF0755 protein
MDFSRNLFSLFFSRFFRGLTALYRTWITGLIYLLAFAGYLFYGILWILRLMQTSKKILIAVLLTAVIAAGSVYYLLCPVGHPGKTVELRVTTGTSLRSIAVTLQKQRVIPWATALILWMKCKGEEKRIQAGLCEFVEHEGAISAAKKLLNARPIEFSVTVPEGLTIEQSAALFHAALNSDSAEFVSLCNNGDFIKTLDIGTVSLEGYLFPDTYRFSEKPSPAAIIKKMVKHFKDSYAALNAAPRMQLGFNEKDIVIIASIVEKEALLASERPRIAAVFYNRLRKGMPLGADPTVRYILRKFSGPLRVSELKVQSPYNTRLHTGLPPGPICSPGMASLKAALFPLQSKELYFVAKWDGSGAHDFSMTYQEHNKKKDTIKRNNDRRIAGGKNAKR